MACFYPKQALRLVDCFTRTGKNVIRFVTDEVANRMKGNPNLLSGLPCGQCVGCRLERSRQWAIRMVHEASLYENNCFITLTFNEESLHSRENPMSLNKKEFQDFMKRFRKRASGLSPVFNEEKGYDEFPIRYYMCGEYGERYLRPHYHAIIFNYDFPDKVLEKVQDGRRYYSSAFLRELWPFGNNIITDVNFDTCAYVARYIMKKSLGKDAWKSYVNYITEDGEMIGYRIPEYTTMSRASGIGKAWLDKYLTDVYPKDRVFLRGRGYSKPPKYYDTQFELTDPSVYSDIKSSRVSQALKKADDNTPSRLEVKRLVKMAQIRCLKRMLE